MKLLFAIKSLTAIGGAERVFCMITGELSRRGHEVVIVTFDPPGTPSFYPIAKSIRRLDLGIGDARHHARVIETLRRLMALRRLAITEQPQVTVGFMHSMFVLIALAYAGLGIPVIGSEHIVPEHYDSHPLEFALIFFTAPLLCNITVLSEVIRDRYPLLIRRRMMVMPNPVIPAAGSANLADDKRYYVLLTVGRLDPQKDQATLIRAFASLATKWPEWRLKIFGEGSLRVELVAMIESLGLVDRIAMPGVTPDIAAEYRGADVFVLPSRYEALGLVTAEAMSYGLPVVGFADCPGTNELIENEKCGLLIEPGTNRSESLARGLERLFADPQLRMRMGEEGAHVVTRIASITSVGDRWERILDAAGKK